MATTEVSLIADHQFHVACEGEAVAVRRRAKAMALDAGFDATAAEEVALAVSELASNIVDHAGDGQITLSTVQQNGAIGMRVEASDRGQGITDLASALTDGFSTAGGLGLGLGAVNRLMDQFDLLPPEEIFSGTCIRCTRWNRAAANPRVTHPLDIGIISRPKPGEQVNGDAYWVANDGQTCLAAVIDGVGHGSAAHRAAVTVQQYVETHSREPLDRIVTGAAYGCQSTQGAVMAIVRLDWAAGILEHVGIGNIETRFLSGGTSGALLSLRGILGAEIPQARIIRQPWQPGDTLVLLSDGLRSSWEWRQFPAASLVPAQQLARELFDSLARDNDDATILVVKYPAH